MVNLLIQPGDGIAPLIQAITEAKLSIDIMIFRFDRTEMERALINAVARGVKVRALIAYTNRGGEKHLRLLESRFLAAGVLVSRTSDDLVRYHDKMMIVDSRELFLLAFNFTYLDIEQSRSFGLAITDPQIVAAAANLFEMDVTRQPYAPLADDFIVSPVNSRKRLAEFLQGAKKELFIYDPRISDAAMMRILEERAAAGVSIKVLGRMTKSIAGLELAKLGQIRLHTRMIIRDRAEAFLGSQSLRAVELDRRREAGLIFRDPAAVESLLNTFLGDWDVALQAKASADSASATPAAKIAKKVAKAMAKSLDPVAPMIQGVVSGIASADRMEIALNDEELEQAVKDAVKKAVKEVIEDALVQ